MLNLSIVLEDSARRHPDRPALVLGERALTYADVDATANRVANLLRSRGIGRGDRVLVLCPNIPDFVAIYFGILKAGAVVVPVNTLLKSRELEYHLRDSEAVAFFCFAGTPDLHSGDEGRQAFAAVDGCRELFVVGNPADPAEQLSTHVADQSTANPGALADESDVAVILYTSGTTGQPKGAQLSHSNLLMNALASMRLLDVTASTHDTHLLALPLFHSFGSTVQMNAGFAAGSTLVLMPRFDPKAALQLMLANEVTVFAGVPTMYWALLNALDETVDVERLRGNLRMAVSGGSALPVQILQDFQTRFGIGILEGYGLSETSPVATFNQPGRPNKAGSIGEPVWGVEVKLIDPEWNTIDADDTVGEIAVRGHNVMVGYLNKPEATAEVLRDGWFRTGDLATRDADGLYYIVDRAKDMIIRGGLNVYPREVEEVLISHPDVSLVAVIGVPDAESGEEIKAVVVRTAGSQLTEVDLIAWSKESMAAYKYPRIVEFVEAMPMTSTGKILKRELS
ncbi:MAG: long-chain fatty acid--CoA ligase [Candidatus Nanopelagicales bacterium]|jgi:long-chain acyl-CoA synthetase